MTTPTEVPAASRRPGGRSARVRALVLAATVDELAARGYASLRPEGVAARAGVNKTTIYRRWCTKEKLVLDAMLQQAAQTVAIPDTGSLRGDLSELAHRSAAIQTSPAGEAVVRAVAGQGPANPEIAAASKRFWADRLELDQTIVQRAKDRGEIDPRVDPRPVIEALLGPLYFRLLVSGEPLDLGFIESIADLVYAGCASRGRYAPRKRGAR